MDKPRVKPLAWVRCEGETAFVAVTPVKTYRLKWVPEFHVWTLSERCYENVNIAKAAAQADYEARILAAIEPAPVSVREAARVVEKAIGLGETLRRIHGNQASAIMPHIWPLLQRYMELVVEDEVNHTVAWDELDARRAIAEGEK